MPLCTYKYVMNAFILLSDMLLASGVLYMRASDIQH